MRYKIEIDGEVLLDVLHWLENCGRYKDAVAIRDKGYYYGGQAKTKEKDSHDVTKRS